jgi:hypothetical protein
MLLMEVDGRPGEKAIVLFSTSPATYRTLPDPYPVFVAFFSPQWKCIGPFRSRAGGAAVVASAVDLTFL